MIYRKKCCSAFFFVGKRVVYQSCTDFLLLCLSSVLSRYVGDRQINTYQTRRWEWYVTDKRDNRAKGKIKYYKTIVKEGLVLLLINETGTFPVCWYPSNLIKCWNLDKARINYVIVNNGKLVTYPACFCRLCADLNILHWSALNNCS